MSIPMYGGAITVNIDRTPLFLDEATRALYNHAIADPSSLTDAERRQITHRPPAEEEDSLCRAACSLSMSELITKAIQHGDSLTYKEAHLLTAGVVPNQAGRLLAERARLSAADRSLTHQAAAAATPEEIKAAQVSAQAVQRRWNIAQIAAAESLSDDDIRNIRYAMRVPWQEHVLSFPDTTVCGLAVFFPDVPGWASFKERIETAIFHGLHCKAQLMDERAIAKFKLHWVESSESDDPPALRSQFESLRNELPAGLRSDSFLYVDREALQSSGAPKPFIWLSELGETGDSLRVHINHIAPTLFARLTQRDLAPAEAKRRPYRHTSELAMLHQAARHSRNAHGEPDGIWPPPARFM